MSALQRRGEANDGQEDTDEEDLVAIENEDMIHSLSEAVIDDMGVVNHPIILDDTNICDLSKRVGHVVPGVVVCPCLMGWCFT